ncbi:GIN domain-containing protein [Parendozoicomonas haliclonae]|uniref:Putative auto-transporter adhesin head GIN domain-containing protein n=1 Tax=Parendozoicomonas haliclonae TaxID=1960125 RepID=A0A1X7AQK3_9GAMM|nr:DUF2807 domain-containing protein [Parendozoicomonas haliclonae]SMA50576.1 hypothetical protein EHSB41UT_04387 [Parendozoicomonas haliclonae]
MGLRSFSSLKAGAVVCSLAMGSVVGAAVAEATESRWTVYRVRSLLDFGQIRKMMDEMLDSSGFSGSFRIPKQIVEESQPALSYRQGPVVGNREISELTVPLPDGDLSRKVVLDLPMELDVVVNPDAVPSLHFSGESNIISRITPELGSKQELTFTTQQALEAYELVKGTLTLPALESFQLNALANVNINLNEHPASRLRLVVNGFGEVKVTGKVSVLNAIVKKGSADLLGLTVEEDLLLRVASYANASVNAEGSILQPDIQKRGSACYSGEPREILSGGSGSIEPCLVLPDDSAAVDEESTKS